MNDIPNIQLGKYRHLKTGKLYEVQGMALQTETNEPLVIYKPLYSCEYALFARPYQMFTECIELNGIQVPRFEKIDS